ncbi:hypothetical protein R6Q57_030065 [Mikania cordata]
MADVVQYKLERMVNELDDLERRGLFSRREIAEIVKQRRKFEYRLKRPSPLKQDYLAYIDYEKSVDALRILRKKAVMRELKKKSDGAKKPKMKQSYSDFAGISRIVEIYRQATNRFKGDIELWFQYLEFCRQKRNGHLKKLSGFLSQVIRFHPKVPGVWIYAASLESTPFQLQPKNPISSDSRGNKHGEILKICKKEILADMINDFFKKNRHTGSGFLQKMVAVMTGSLSRLAIVSFVVQRRRHPECKRHVEAYKYLENAGFLLLPRPAACLYIETALKWN